MTIPGYRLQIITDSKEFKPFLQLGEGPFYRNIYTLIGARNFKNGEYAEPYIQREFHDIDGLVAVLEAWKIPIDEWEPDEVEGDDS